MIESIRVHKRSQYDQYILMNAIADYCDNGAFEGWWKIYPQSSQALAENFASIINWDQYVRVWTSYFVGCFENGCIAFTADPSNGCSFEITNKIFPEEDGSYTIYQYSNVTDAICIGTAEDLFTAIFYSIRNFGCYITNWKYRRLEEWK